MPLSRFLSISMAAALLFSPTLASAHAKLVASTPAANVTVAKPGKIELKFNEKIIAKMAKAEIVMTGMPGMADHAPMPITGFTAKMGPDGKSMTLQLKRALTAGTYKVTWYAAGADTHRLSGNFTFKVK